MKSVWNGSISFGLVNIPVQLFSAAESRRTSFRLLHKKHKSPIRYLRTCDECDDEVDWSEISKGVDIGGGEYVLFEKEELKAIRPEKTDMVDITEFVDSQQIDPIYFDKSYYVAPSKKKDKAFFLFKEALQQSAKAAIGKFVMREKEYVCAIESYKEGLLLVTLNYAEEIRDISKLENLQEKPALNEGEKKLAQDLIGKMTGSEFSIEKYEDTFAEALQKLVEKKRKGERITVEERPVEVTREENLMETLKASLEA